MLFPYGVYFYSQATDEKEAEEEARFVIKTLALYKPKLPIIIDYEYPVDEKGDNTGRMWEATLSKQECKNTVAAFCEKVQKYGYMASVYASSYLYNNDINLYICSQHCRFFRFVNIARYDKPMKQ